MMLKETIKSPKSKAVIVSLIVIFLITIVYCVTQSKENNKTTLKAIEYEEFNAYLGDWKIAEYLGESVEYHGAEAITETEKDKNDKIAKEIKEKYLNKVLHIDSQNITTFSPPVESGYHVLDWTGLFSIYRQPSDIWNSISPPFLCSSFNLKDYEDSFDLIIDTNGIATLVVKGQFFRLEKTVKD